MLFDKFIYDTQEPKTQSVLWIRPQLGKEVTIEAFIDGKWKTIGGGDPSKYLTKEAFEAFKATYNQTIDGLEHRITDLETVINRSSYVITLQKDPSTTGTVSGGGRFISGTSVTVVATPDAQSDYPEFDGWYEGGTKVSENASYTFTVSGTRTLVAKFKEATPTPPSETLFYKNIEGVTGFFVVNTEGRAIYNKQGMGFSYADGVINIQNVGSAPIPKKQYDFTFNPNASTQEITIDGVTYTFMKRESSGYTIAPSINAFPS